MSSPFKRDVVKEYADAFRAAGLKVMMYYSVLDTHHNLRKGHITAKHIDLVRQQITELFSNYGEITALFIDGWESPWARISYDDIPFENIYLLIKSLQPNCLIMDLNASKSAWVSNIHVKEPWYEADMVKEQPFNLIVLTVPRSDIREYRRQVFSGGNGHRALSDFFVFLEG